MSWRRQTTIVAGMMFLLVFGACGDATRTDGPSDYETQRKPVKVIPKFELDGTHNFPDNVRFDDLGLTVASIKLTPVEDEQSVAYSTSDPNSIEFDVENGPFEREGRGIELPRTGKFDVTLRLEPVEEEADGSGEQSNPYSLSLSGHVAGIAKPEVSDGDVNDGRPIPVPASPDEFDTEMTSTTTEADDRTGNPAHWMPFEYSTRESVRMTLDAVELVEGTQYLRFRFDAEEWASELAEPVVRAVWSKTQPDDSTNDGEAVDVTNAVDSRGEGSKSLSEHMSVTADRGGNPGGGGL